MSFDHDLFSRLPQREYRDDGEGPVVLPQSILGRIALGLLCATYLPFSSLALYYLTPMMILPVPTWQAWLLRATMWEFMFALTLVSVSGLIWAFFTPEWIRPFARRYARRLSLLLLLPFLFLTAYYFWPF